MTHFIHPGFVGSMDVASNSRPCLYFAIIVYSHTNIIDSALLICLYVCIF